MKQNQAKRKYKNKEYKQSRTMSRQNVEPIYAWKFSFNVEDNDEVRVFSDDDLYEAKHTELLVAVQLACCVDHRRLKGATPMPVNFLRLFWAGMYFSSLCIGLNCLIPDWNVNQPCSIGRGSCP